MGHESRDDRLCGKLRSPMTNVNLNWHEESASPDIPETTMPGANQRPVREKAVDELSRLVILFGYLCVVYKLLSVNKSIVLSEYHLNYAECAFAFINSLVFARVLLTRNCIWDFVAKLLRHVSAKPHRSLRPASPWAANSSPNSMPYLHYLSQETVVGSAHAHVASAQSN
jgi:hypothetical protein